MEADIAAQAQAADWVDGEADVNGQIPAPVATTVVAPEPAAPAAVVAPEMIPVRSSAPAGQTADAQTSSVQAVLASNMGDARFPGWWYNLQASPEAGVRAGRRRVRVRARRAGPEEEERLWPRLEEVYSYYPDYRARAGREVPIVMLEPIA